MIEKPKKLNRTCISVVGQKMTIEHAMLSSCISILTMHNQKGGLETNTFNEFS